MFNFFIAFLIVCCYHIMVNEDDKNCPNSHFRISSSDITNYMYVIVDFAMAILASLKVWLIDWLIDWLRLKDNQTALHIASRVGDVDMVELLISRGASINVITADRYTPLHIAAKEGHDDVAALLLDHGVTSSPITKARLLSILAFGAWLTDAFTNLSCLNCCRNLPGYYVISSFS